MKDEPEFEFHFFGMKVVGRNRYGSTIAAIIVVFALVIAAIIPGLVPG